MVTGLISLCFLLFSKRFQKTSFSRNLFLLFFLVLYSYQCMVFVKLLYRTWWLFALFSKVIHYLVLVLTFNTNAWFSGCFKQDLSKGQIYLIMLFSLSLSFLAYSLPLLYFSACFLSTLSYFFALLKWLIVMKYGKII